MTARNERPTGWFKLSSAFYADSKILQVSMPAEMLFVRMLALCAATSSGGVVTAKQMVFLNRGIRNTAAVCSELVDAGLLFRAPLVHDKCKISASEVQDQCTTSARSVHCKCKISVLAGQDYVISAYNRWNSLNAGPAEERPAQARSNQGPSSMAGSPPRARGPARATDRKKEREEVRTASPNVRTSSARAAQRLGGADAQPALVEDQKQSQDQEPPPVAEAPVVGDSLVGLEHLSGPELAQAALQKADLANGRIRMPIQMWKYPREFTRLSEPKSESEPLGEEQ